MSPVPTFVVALTCLLLIGLVVIHDVRLIRREERWAREFEAKQREIERLERFDVGWLESIPVREPRRVLR
jgi:hypothetical protein